MYTSHAATIRSAVLGMLASLMLHAPAQAQAPPRDKPLSLAGPRFGVTYLSDSIVVSLTT